MPNVPTFTSDRNIAVAPRVDMPAPGPAAMGAGLFQGAMSAAGDIGAAMEQAQRKRDDLAASTAYTEYAGMVGQYLHGQTAPDGSAIPGALSQQGYGAQNITAGFAARVKNLDGNFAKKLTPEQYQIWKARADILTQNTMERLTAHEVAQVRAGDAEAWVANADAVRRDSLSGTNWAQPEDQFRDLYEIPMLTNMRNGLEKQGMAPQKVAELMRQAEEKLSIDRVQAAIGAQQWGKAQELMDAAGRNGARINDEQRGALRQNVEVGMARQKQAAEHEAAKAQKEIADQENEKFASAMMNIDWTDPAAVSSIEDNLRASPDQTVALHYFDRVQGMKAAVAAEKQKSAAQAAKERGAEDYQINVVRAENGILVGKDGKVRVLAPAERAAMLDQQVMNGSLKLEDRNRIMGEVKKGMSAREGDFTKRALTEVMPDSMKYFAMQDGSSELAIDSDGSLRIGRGKDKAFFTPDTATGYKRRYIAPGAGGVPQRKADVLTISNIQDALAMVRSQLRADPKMSIANAVEEFRKLTATDAKVLAIGSFEDQMREKSELVRKMQENMYRASNIPVRK